MAITWPSSLPQSFLIQGFSLKRQPQAISTDPSMGPAIRRRRFSSNVEIVSGNMIMTDTQWTTFVDFYDNTLKGGVLSFDWKHPITGNTATMRFIADKDDAVAITERFTDKYYLVSMRLEILP